MKALLFEAVFDRDYVPTTIIFPLEKIADQIAEKMGDLFEVAKDAAREDARLERCQLIAVTPMGEVVYQRRAYEREIPDQSLCALLYAPDTAQFLPKLLAVDRLYTIAVDLRHSHPRTRMTWVVYAWILEGNLPNLYDRLDLAALIETRFALRAAGRELLHPERYAACLKAETRRAVMKASGKERKC